MTSGPPVQLPPLATGVLNNIVCDNWARVEVYFLSSSNLTAASLVPICDTMTESYVVDLLGEEQVEDYHQFLQPVLQPLSSVQDCIDNHFECLDKWLIQRLESEDCSKIYPHGILVFDKDEKEALLIHIDQRNKIWHIGSIYLPIEDLELSLTSLIFGDEWFGDMCDQHNVRVPQNDPEIDENYKEYEKDETGAWKNNTPRFAVFSTGCDNAGAVTCWMMLTRMRPLAILMLKSTHSLGRCILETRMRSGQGFLLMWRQIRGVKGGMKEKDHVPPAGLYTKASSSRLTILNREQRVYWCVRWSGTVRQMRSLMSSWPRWGERRIFKPKELVSRSQLLSRRPSLRARLMKSL
jgi:hypothetical protein